jgi:hypothetical protein
MTPRKSGNGKTVRSNFLRRRRVAQAAADVERGLKDTDRRGVPNDIPTQRRRRV